MDLKMEIYSPDLEVLGRLQTCRSVIWEEKAFSAGSFSVESLITEEARALLVPDHILWIEGNTAGIIEYIHLKTGEDGPYITAKGRMLSGILDRRILWGRYSLSGTVTDIMRDLVEDCCIHPTRGDVESRKIRNLVLEKNSPAGGAVIRSQRTGGSLLEVLEDLGETYGVSFGVRFNPEVPRMEFWCRHGVDWSVHQTHNEPVFYSTELYDVLASEYAYDSGDHRNIALVAGEGEGNDRVLVTVNADGEAEELNPVDFIPHSDTIVMRTSDKKRFTVHPASSGEESYVSAYTGPQIDEGITKAITGGGGGGSSGVTSFNGRKGAVIPQANDYTARQISCFSVSGMNSTNVQDAISELFTSVSEGKAMLASAITDKGVVTAADASFPVMRSNILAIPSGGNTGSGTDVIMMRDPDRMDFSGVFCLLDYTEAVNAVFEIQTVEGFA